MAIIDVYNNQEALSLSLSLSVRKALSVERACIVLSAGSLSGRRALVLSGEPVSLSLSLSLS